MDALNKVKIIGAVLFVAYATLAAELSLDECQEKASSGVAEAQWQLGQRYEEGRGVRKNGFRAVVQYKKAAEQKHRKACARLAELYSSGEYVKKDAVLAAKYKAWADGENESIAVAKAENVEKVGKVDDIEVALDYLLGRNGKTKDSKGGLRILYAAGKDNPVAQQVFVRRWCKGDLDAAIDVLTDEEFELIIPWFIDGFKVGLARTGWVLGNYTYNRAKAFDGAKYVMALNEVVKYWRGAGLSGDSRAWYKLGLLYSRDGKNEFETELLKGQGFRSDYKAKDAFERALRINQDYVDAKIELGCLYLFSRDKTVGSISKAVKTFSELYKRYTNDKWVVYYYGLSMYAEAKDAIGKNYDRYKAAMDYKYGAGRIDNNIKLKAREECEVYIAKYHKSLEHIKRAANMGCEPARKFLDKVTGSDESTSTSNSEHANITIESRMKAMILPSIKFGPPATLIDAVDFFRQSSVDFDRQDIPQNRRGFKILLRLSSEDQEDIPKIPNLSAKDISFYDCLTLVCKVVGYKFEIIDGSIVVMPK